MHVTKLTQSLCPHKFQPYTKSFPKPSTIYDLLKQHLGRPESNKPSRSLGPSRMQGSLQFDNPLQPLLNQQHTAGGKPDKKNERLAEKGRQKQPNVYTPNS